jgi:long-chain acyl-CoA synthetase
MTNLAENLIATAEKHPDRTAIRLDSVALTWAQLRDLALAAAG